MPPPQKKMGTFGAFAPCPPPHPHPKGFCSLDTYTWGLKATLRPPAFWVPLSTNPESVTALLQNNAKVSDIVTVKIEIVCQKFSKQKKKNEM